MSQTPAPFDTLPDSAYLREAELVQKPSNPTPIIPASASTLWRWVKAGTFPAPRKIGPKVTAWRVGDIRAWLAEQAEKTWAPAETPRSRTKRKAVAHA